MSILDFIPVVGPALAAGVDAIAGNANAQAARDAFKNRYQDTVRDMRKAGLNPALAYGQGGGNPQTHDRPLPGEQLSKSAQMFGSATQARANAELTDAQAKLLKMQTVDLADQVKLRNAQILTETATSGAQGGVAMRQQEQINMSIQNMRYEQMFLKGTLEDRVRLIRRDLEKRGVEIDAIRIQNYLNRLSGPRKELGSDVASSARDIFRAARDFTVPGVKNFTKNFRDTFR